MLFLFNIKVLYTLDTPYSVAVFHMPHTKTKKPSSERKAK